MIENHGNSPLLQLQCIPRSVRLRPVELHQALADMAFQHSLKSNRPRAIDRNAKSASEAIGRS